MEGAGVRGDKGKGSWIASGSIFVGGRTTGETKEDDEAGDATTGGSAERNRKRGLVTSSPAGEDAAERGGVGPPGP